MLNLSPIVKEDKNLLSSDGVFLPMLKIQIPSITETIRIVDNTDDIVWNSETWQKFPFQIDQINENSNGERGQFKITVSNLNGVIGQYVRQYDNYVKINGFEPVVITLYVINTKDLLNTLPVFSQEVIMSKPEINQIQVNFTVAAKDLFRINVPTHRMFTNSCRFKFKGNSCGYTGIESLCDKTLARCRELNNSARYGGFPLIGNQGVVI
jgi:lambda family phage minor tail protein L